MTCWQARYLVSPLFKTDRRRPRRKWCVLEPRSELDRSVLARAKPLRPPPNTNTATPPRSLDHASSTVGHLLFGYLTAAATAGKAPERTRFGRRMTAAAPLGAGADGDARRLGVATFLTPDAFHSN